MVHLLADGGDYDFEFSGSKIYFYKTFGLIAEGTIPIKQKTYDNMLNFGIESAKSLVRASRPAKVISTDNVAEMWQLYGFSNAKLVMWIGIIIFSFFFITTCLFIPPFWPIGAVVATLFYLRYRRLLAKRKKLASNWHRDLL